MGSFRVAARLACAGLLASAVAALPASAQSGSAPDLAKACAAEAHLPVPGDMVGKRWNEMDPDAALTACRAAFDVAPEDYRVAADLGRALLRAGEYRLAQELLGIVADKSPQAQFSLAMSNLSIGNLPTSQEVEGAKSSTHTVEEPADSAAFSENGFETYTDSATDYSLEESGGAVEADWGVDA